MPNPAGNQDINFQPKTKEYSYTNAPKEKKNSLNTILTLLFSVLGFLFLFFIFLVVLNYFNIISIPSFTSLNNFLPKQTGIQKEPSEPDVAPIRNIPLANCPLEEKCTNAIQLGQTSDSYSQEFAGLGFTKISTQAAILAAIDGRIEVKNITEEEQKITLVIMTNPNLNMKITYKFGQNSYSSIISSGNVSQNQKIGILEKDSAVNYQSKTYSLIVYIQNLNADNYIRINPSKDGGKTLDNYQ